ncbi:MAG: hypothetical protein ACXVCP_09805 [Bdellovibrio sp.]
MFTLFLKMTLIWTILVATQIMGGGRAYAVDDDGIKPRRKVFLTIHFFKDRSNFETWKEFVKRKITILSMAPLDGNFGLSADLENFMSHYSSDVVYKNIVAVGRTDAKIKLAKTISVKDEIIGLHIRGHGYRKSGIGGFRELGLFGDFKTPAHPRLNPDFLDSEVHDDAGVDPDFMDFFDRIKHQFSSDATITFTACNLGNDSSEVRKFGIGIAKYFGLKNSKIYFGAGFDYLYMLNLKDRLLSKLSFNYIKNLFKYMGATTSVLALSQASNFQISDLPDYFAFTFSLGFLLESIKAMYIQFGWSERSRGYGYLFDLDLTGREEPIDIKYIYAKNDKIREIFNLDKKNKKTNSCFKVFSQ